MDNIELIKLAKKLSDSVPFGNATSFSQWLKVAVRARELLAKPAAPLPPICGLALDDLKYRMATEPLSYPTEPWLDRYARAVHRLAQPAPVEDVDKEAKALAFIHWSQRSDSREMVDGKTEDTLWLILSIDERNGWRAVAAAMKKGAGDE